MGKHNSFTLTQDVINLLRHNSYLMTHEDLQDLAEEVINMFYSEFDDSQETIVVDGVEYRYGTYLRKFKPDKFEEASSVAMEIFEYSGLEIRIKDMTYFSESNAYKLEINGKTYYSEFPDEQCLRAFLAENDMVDLDDTSLDGKEILTSSKEYWVKIVEFLQQNWALIEQAENNNYVTVFFINDASDVFDKIYYSSAEQAEQALLMNGFKLYNDPKEDFRKFISIPPPPYCSRKYSTRKIYSSGEYWKF